MLISSGPGGKRIADKLSGDYRVGSLFRKKNISGEFFGIIAVFFTLLGIGDFVLSKIISGLVMTAITLIKVVVVV